MSYLFFFLNNKKLISFGFSLALFSSFGQTFLISLYVPDIMNEFHLSSFSFGMIYGSATIMSGLTLAFLGKFIDQVHLRDYTLAAVFLLMASCSLLGFSVNPVLVFLGLWGLRLAGQGLLTHISQTSISRFFDSKRGMALSLSALGYSAGEAFFPITIGMVILYAGWRGSLFLSAAFVSLILIPFILTALKNKNIQIRPKESLPGEIPVFSRQRLLKDKRFYIIAFNSFVLFSTITGLFFYQLLLAQEKGWTVKWITGSFLGFAAGRTVFSLVGGKLIDRFSAMAVFPFYLIPFALGLLVLSIFSHPLIAPIYFILTGVSVGFSSTLSTALLAEVYGTRNLGGIRAALSSITVFGTALSPAFFGFLLDQGFNFTFISAGSMGVILAAVFISRQLPAAQRHEQM